ncbi:MAG: PEGA domain-containing protein [Brevinematia bacterium]
MNKLKIILPLITVFLVSCVGGINQIINIPKPNVKSQIKVFLNTITNVGELKPYQTEYYLNIISNNIYTFNFSEVEEELPKTELTDNLTNLKEDKNIEQSNTTKQNITTIYSQQEIDINKLVDKTLRRNFSSFIRSLGKVSIKPEEMIIQNIQDIEKAILEKTNSLPDLKTNYITNLLFETNYYLAKETNKVLVEILEKEEIIEELKVSKDYILKVISNTTPWIFRITNNITFVEDKSSDISVNILWKLEPILLNTNLTNFSIKLTFIISNNISSNFTILKTNLMLEDFLLSDYRIFSSIRPFLYNFKTGILKVDLTPKEYDIYIDDFLFGKEVNEYFAEGIHKITLSKGSYATNEYIYIQSGKINIYKKDISRDFANIGKIKINSIPSGADIFIESEYYGKTPLEIQMPYGTYRIRAEKNNLRKFTLVEHSKRETELWLELEDLNNKMEYNISTGITTLLGTLTVSSIFLYFWADNQERYYDFLYSKDNKPEYWNMKIYYYYFKDNMRTTAITGSILTLITWGITLGIESDKFFIKTTIKF